MIEASVHLHRGDGHKARTRFDEFGGYFEVADENDNSLTIFVPNELESDAKAFAESINTFCQPRVKAVGA